LTTIAFHPVPAGNPSSTASSEVVPSLDIDPPYSGYLSNRDEDEELNRDCERDTSESQVGRVAEGDRDYERSTAISTESGIAEGMDPRSDVTNTAEISIVVREEDSAKAVVAIY
jgi:hypothetical protein